MQHASQFTQLINYQLYRNAGRSEVWGDGNSGTVTVAGTGNGAPQAATIYGRVPAQITPNPGSYADQVVVTVTY
jgi:spore coat protein U-like protein